MMNKVLMGIILLSVCLFLSGCSGFNVNSLSDRDLQRISDKAVVCNAPYIRFGASCCIDQNNNSICDTDESATSTTPVEGVKCINECSEDLCLNGEYIACQTKSDGCKDKVNKGKLLGKCGIICLSDNDCSSTEKCNGNTCEAIECTNQCTADTCKGTTYLKCMTANTGCKIKEDMGIVKDKCGVECLKNSDCTSNKICSSHSCVNSGSMDLSDFPSMFIKDGQFDGTLVVGANAPTEHILGIVDIATALQFADGSKDSQKVSVGAAVQDTEISDIYNQNLIVVGSPCVNSVAAALFGISMSDPDCYDQFPVNEGQGVIKLIKTGNYYQLLVMGYSAADVRKTCQVLANYEEYISDFKDQTEVIISGLKVIDEGIHNIQGTLNKGETKVYTVDGKSYEVTIVIISADVNGIAKAKFMINGEVTSSMSAPGYDTLDDGTVFSVSNIVATADGNDESATFEFSVPVN
jgi:hypothetical protein